jgi:hypothetical protein
LSLTGPDDFRPERGAVMVSGVGQLCFFCERKIRKDPCWTWAGATGAIFLHLTCAVDFAIRMFADLFRWQRRTRARFGEAGGK